jgi:hypothetical protein
LIERAEREQKTKRREKMMESSEGKIIDRLAEKNPTKIAILLLAFLALILIFLSTCFPWFVFAGTAEYFSGTVEVSGSVSEIGVGTLDRTGASVTVWSSPTYWSSAGSDFWFGYLTVVGLILVSLHMLFLIKKDGSKISALLASIGGLMALSASLITLLYYNPQVLVIHGYIAPEIGGINAALLYVTRATLKNGVGLWLSLAGGILSIISAGLTYHFKGMWGK